MNHGKRIEGAIVLPGGGIRLALLLSVLLGVSVGLGGFTFFYARGDSYLTNDPMACANCHVMQRYFDAWTKSSHRSAAVCNDCHTPRSLVGKYATKAVNGFFHSLAFTTGNFKDPIQIKGFNRDIAEQACRKCHSAITEAIDAHSGIEPISCVRCHGSVGHRL